MSKVENSLQSKRFSDLLCYFLSSFLWNKNRPLWFQYLMAIFSHLQVLSILLWIKIVYIYNPNSSGSFSKLLSFRNWVFFIDESSSNSVWTTVSIVSIYFVVLIATFLALLFAYKRHKKSSITIKNIISYWAQFHHEVLCWVIQILLSLILYQQNTDNLNNYILSPLIIFLLSLNQGFSALFAFYCFDPFRNRNKFACEGTIFQFITFLYKGIMSLLLVMPYDSVGIRHVILAFSLVILASRHYVLIKTYPYYNYNSMRLIGIISTISLFLTFSNSLMWYSSLDFKGSWLTTCFFEIAFLCMCVKIFLGMFQMNLLHYLKKEPHHLRNRDDVQKKLFSIFSLLSNTHIWIDDENSLIHTKSFLYLMSSIVTNREALKNEIPTSYNQPPKKENHQQTLQNSYKFQQAYSERLYDIAIDILTTLIEQLNCKNKLKFELAYLSFERKGLYPKTIFLLTCVSRDAKNHKERVIVNEYKRYVEQSLFKYLENREEGTLDLKRATDFEQLSASFLDDLMVNTNKFMRLWDFYLESKFSLRNFINMSSNFEKEAEKLQKKWDELNKIYGYLMINLYPLYSSYLALVRNAIYSSIKVDQKYYLLKDVRRKENDRTSPLLPESLLGTRNLLIQVTMSKEKLGKVAHCSKNVTHELGWRPEEIIDKNCVYIMPPYMQDKHQNILVSNLESLPRKFFNTYIHSFVRTNEGYLKPATTIATIYPYIKEELMYFGIIRVHHFEFESIALDENGYVDSFTKSIAKDLNLSITDKRVHIKKLCPFFQKNLSKGLKACGFSKDTNPFPLSQSIGKITQAVQNNPELAKEIQEGSQFQSSQPFVLKLSFVNYDGGYTRKYLASFEVKDIFQSNVIIMNLYQDKVDDGSPKKFSEASEGFKEDEELEINEALDEFEENEQTKYLTHKSLLLDDTNRFSMKALCSKVKEKKSDIMLESLQFDSSNDAIPSSQEDASVRSKGRQTSLFFSQRNPFREPSNFGSQRFPSLSRMSSFGDSGQRQTMRVRNPVSEPMKYLLLRHRSRMSTYDYIPTNAPSQQKINFDRTQLSAKMNSPAQDFSSKDQRGDNKEIYQEKAKDASKISSCHNTASFSYITTQKRLEQGLYFVPKDGSGKGFSGSMKCFLILCVGLLCLLLFFMNRQVQKAQSGREISKAIGKRRQLAMDIYATADFLGLINAGLIEVGHSSLEDLHKRKREQIRSLALDLQNTNMKVSSLIDESDKGIHKEVRTKRLYREYTDSQISNITLESFNIFDQIVLTGLKISHDNVVPLDSNSSALKFLKYNVLNGLILSDDLIAEDVESFTISVMEIPANVSLYVMLAVGFIGIFILLIFFNAERQAVMRRNQLIDGFLMLDEELIKEHMSEIRIFSQNLQKDLFNREYYYKLCGSVKEKKSKGALKHKKSIKRKSVNKVGINMPYVRLALLIGIIVLLVNSVFLILFVMNSNFKDLMIKLIEQFTKVEQFHQRMDLLQQSFYTLIETNTTGSLKYHPIEEEWENIYNEMIGANSYLSKLLNQLSSSEHEDYVKSLILGDLCEGAKIGISFSNCNEIAEGVLQRGLMSLNSFLLSGLRRTKDSFIFSNRSEESQRLVFNMREIKMNEEIREPYMTLAYRALERFLEQQMENKIHDFVRSKAETIVIIYFVIYMIIRLVFFKNFEKLAQDQKDVWRKLFRQIPSSALSSNKHLIYYLGNNSNGLIGSFEKRLL